LAVPIFLTVDGNGLNDHLHSIYCCVYSERDPYNWRAPRSMIERPYWMTSVQLRLRRRRMVLFSVHNIPIASKSNSTSTIQRMSSPSTPPTMIAQTWQCQCCHMWADSVWTTECSVGSGVDTGPAWMWLIWILDPLFIPDTSNDSTQEEEADTSCSDSKRSSSPVFFSCVWQKLQHWKSETAVLNYCYYNC
jgi:hypothetical protein